ncbi:MAG: rhamnulokinase [Candidatus Sumerlaeaceae bacterium]
MTTRRYIAFDFGAESGRAIVGTIANGKLDLDVLHRFSTEGLVMQGRRQWDVTRMYAEMLTGLTAAARKYGPHFDGVGVDTWGVDFGLLASDGTLLANPTHYRDKAHASTMDELFAAGHHESKAGSDPVSGAIGAISRNDVYKRTGIQFLPFNTAWQLVSLVQRNSPLLECADKLLLMGDVFGYLLSGCTACEYTNASTTQLLNPNTRTWDDELVSHLGIPRHLLQPIIQPGSVLGALLPEIAAHTGIAPGTPVISPATHDTGSAVVAVPAAADTSDWAYLSSGTWSLMGAELGAPIVNEQSLALNYTSEGGYGGTIRFLKNIIGLWILQECRRCWQRELNTELPYAQLMEDAAAAQPFGAIINVDDPRLLAPENMCDIVQTLANESGYPDPLSRPQMTRCVLESLALRYRRTLHELDSLTGRTTRTLHVIGGGSQNTLLCQMTADACGISVLAGPAEATAIGNIAVQAIATGAVDSLAAARQLIAKSFSLTRYEPVADSRWDRLGEPIG